jgi:predicted MFS family arabinose efflux permease
MLTAGAGFTFVHSTLQARASEALPKMRATAISFFAFAVFAGSGIGTFVLGALLPSVGYGPALFGGGACLWLFTWAARRFSAPPPSAKQE